MAEASQDKNSVQGNDHVVDASRSRGHAWWERRSGLERVLGAVCLLLLVSSICLVVANIVIRGRLKLAEKRASRTCHTPECIRAASLMLEKMDSSAAPCTDFYEYACGRYLTRNTVPDDHHLRSTIQTMQDEMYVTLKKLIELPASSNDSDAILKIKKLYTSCMNTSSIEDGSVGVLRDLLTANGVGEWPILDADWDESEVLLEWRLTMLHIHQVQPFFYTFIAPDDRNSSVYMLHVYSGSPILNTQYYLNSSDPDYNRYIASYKNLISETARLLRASEDVVRRDVNDMLQFEVRFANITQDSYSDYLDKMMDQNGTSSSDEEFVFNKVNISMLQEMIPEIDWGMLIGYVFDYVGVSLDKMDLTIVMHCEKYLQHLVGLLNSTSPRTIANYLTWRFVAKYLPYLDIHFRRLYYDFRREVPNLSEDRTFLSRWKECVHLVNDGFGMALASLYVQQQFSGQLEHQVKTLISSLKQAFVRGINQQVWLDSDTKALCEEKVEAMNSKIGFPKYILDPVQLDTDYSGLEISEEHFLDNILKMNRFEVRKELTKMTRAVDKEKDWFVLPLVVNAYYEATGNTVIFPVGILGNPIFDVNRPKYLNYGMFGVVVGHEITHGFDTGGRKFDKVGNMTQWWSDEMIERFKEKATCFVDQYSDLPIDMVGQNVNGNQTLDDNICDNSALRQAYRAYESYVAENGEEAGLPGITLSNTQVFFLQYAQIWCEVLSKEANERYIKDSHSPGHYRANIPLMNSPEFAAAFECPLGSPMNPAYKCRLWG